MGFSCFICKKPFQEEEHASQKGGGDGKTANANASATICGHLFHSRCLQDYFDKISHNAWSPKQCPVCTADLGVRDVIRVHAYPYDNNNFPAVEDLQEQLKQIQLEKMEAFKRYETVYKENCSLKYSLEARIHDCEEWAARYEHVVRLNKSLNGDNELLKSEIVKLKNMVIKLTERITGIDEIPYQDTEANNGMITPSNLGGVPFVADAAGFSNSFEIHMAAANNNNYSFNNNGSQMKSISYSHPPGFILPIMQPDAVSELSTSPNSGPDQQQRVLATFNEEAFKLVARECNNNIPNSAVGTGRPQPQSVPLFARVRKESSPTSSNDNANNVTSEARENASNISATLTSKANDFPDEPNHHGPNDPGCGKIGNMNKSPFPNDSQRSIDVSSPKVATTSEKNGRNDSTYKDCNFVDYETEENENWCEKRSKRRSSGSRGSSLRSSLTTHVRSDDKRYGYFKCPTKTCGAEWGSSKSVLNQPQVCRYCKTEVHPYKQDFILSRKQLELKQLEASQAKISSKKK